MFFTSGKPYSRTLTTAIMKKPVSDQKPTLAPKKRMASSTAQKLRIREGDSIFPIHPPIDYEPSLGALPPGSHITATATGAGHVHWFVKNKAQMQQELKTILELVKANKICWVFFPKGSSNVQTDLNRDSVWEQLMKHDLQFLTLVSFNDTWSAFGLRQKTEKENRKEEQAKERPVLEFVDPQTRTVKLPPDFAAALRKNKAQEDFFQSLSFTNKKEYIEWMVSAKKEETRTRRVKESIERLAQGWKNPANR